MIDEVVCLVMNVPVHHRLAKRYASTLRGMIAAMSVTLVETGIVTWTLWCTRTSAVVTILACSSDAEQKLNLANIGDFDSPAACTVHCGPHSPGEVKAAEAAVIRFGDNAPSARELSRLYRFAQSRRLTGWDKRNLRVPSMATIMHWSETVGSGPVVRGVKM
jgi:hypothetical protein